MKLNRISKAILVFMASTPGRWARISMGVMVIALALTQGGWALLLAPLGGFMIYSGAANVCPLGPAFRQPFRSAELLKSLQKYDLK